MITMQVYINAQPTLPNGVGAGLAPINLVLRQWPPGEVQTPPEAPHAVAARAPVLQRVLVYQVNLGAQYSCAVLLDPAQQGLQPGVHGCQRFFINIRKGGK